MNILKFFKKKKPITNTKKVLAKIDQDGNKWYAFSHPGDMHIDRELALRDAEEYWKLNITRDWLKEWIAGAEEHLNNGRISDLGVYFFELKTRLELLASKTAYLQFCAVFYLLNDEDPDRLDNDYVKQKFDLLEKYSDLRDFFLHDLCVRYVSLEQDTLETLKTYLAKMEKIDKATWERSSVQTLLATK